MVKVDEKAADVFKKDNTVIDKGMMTSSTELIEYRKQRLQAEANVKMLKEKEDQIIENLYSQMIAKGIKSFNRDDGIKVIAVIKSNYYPKDPESEQKLFKKLKFFGDGGMIKEKVSFQTLQSFMRDLKERTEEGGDIKAKKRYMAYTKFVEIADKRSIQVRGLKEKNKE